jgi:thiosulfate/3-mercaptopyruvate sulfurtransferase
MTEQMPPLVDAQWLRDHIGEPDLVVLDASWYLPGANRDVEGEFLAGHIPGALRFDFDKRFADTEIPLPHMLARPDDFSREARVLGLNNSNRVVVYDTAGIFAAPRAWWMFKAMGHEAVTVLDGGLPAWTAAGGKLETGPEKARPQGDFEARRDLGRVRDAQQVKSALEDGSANVVDARPAGRFTGADKEARAGLRSGHMPGSRNLPFDRLLENGRYASPEKLASALKSAGIEPGKPSIASCGSGVTASIVALAAEAAIGMQVPVYDGAWSEWGQETRPDLPVAIGEA